MNEIRYLDPGAPIAERVGDLLGRMTLEEKVGQIMQLDGRFDMPDAVGRMFVGSLFHLNGSEADAAIDAALRTRLGIPLLMADDGIHGHSFWAGATIFPTQLALSCSWDVSLLRRVARVAAREMRATGIKWTFSPVLCLARDLRWGRISETFGEDPFLIGEFASAMIRGYQGEGLGDPEAVLADRQALRRLFRDARRPRRLRGRALATQAPLLFFPPFERASREGCMAFMTGYQAIDGLPSTINRWLLTEVLKEEWGFEGVLVTDYDNVGRLVKDQRVCADYAEASALAIRSGNDFIMATPQFFDGCLEAVRRGLLTERELDQTVRRVLALKFRMGLFENPGRSDPERIAKVIGCEEHVAANLEAARESLVLLKNDAVGGASILPLDAGRPRRIAVLGPNADDPLAQLGDWSLGSGQMTSPSGAGHPRASIVCALDGVRSLMPAGWSLAKDEHEADIVLLVLGDRLDYTGEEKSTATLELQDGQVELAARIAALGKPMIVALIGSKPLVLPKAVLEAQAILECFNPGMQGGRALAEAIFGVVNPSGKLTISIPYHVGQQPVYYNQVRGQHGRRYADCTQEPAFAFGYGLGYSRFEYGTPIIESTSLKRDGDLRVTVPVRNAGNRAGTEIVQLYVEDDVTSATWARRELVAFSRSVIAAGQTRLVELTAPVSELWIIDGEGKRVVESGEFRALVGSSSRDRDLQELRFTVE